LYYYLDPYLRVGAGSVMVDENPDGVTVVGAPAQIIRRNNS